jgi:Sensors of blue-light using FAD
MLTQLIYVSTPVPEYQNEVISSFADNRIQNQKIGINGMILSHKNFYLQILEGEREAVNNLYHSIVADHRHTDLLLIRYQEIQRPHFTDWHYAVIDQKLDEIFYRYINDLVNVDENFNKDLTSSCAMALFRRARAVLLATLSTD